MKRLDYYIMLSALLAVGLWLLYFGEELYSGLFLWLFIAKVENLLNNKDDDNIEMYDNTEIPENIKNANIK